MSLSATKGYFIHIALSLRLISAYFVPTALSPRPGNENSQPLSSALQSSAEKAAEEDVFLSCEKEDGEVWVHVEGLEEELEGAEKGNDDGYSGTPHSKPVVEGEGNSPSKTEQGEAGEGEKGSAEQVEAGKGGSWFFNWG